MDKVSHACIMRAGDPPAPLLLASELNCVAPSRSPPTAFRVLAPRPESGTSAARRLTLHGVVMVDLYGGHLERQINATCASASRSEAPMDCQSGSGTDGAPEKGDEREPDFSPCRTRIAQAEHRRVM